MLQIMYFSLLLLFYFIYLLLYTNKLNKCLQQKIIHKHLTAAIYFIWPFSPLISIQDDNNYREGHYRCLFMSLSPGTIFTISTGFSGLSPLPVLLARRL